ncbi:MAG: glycosyltransferase, partial [Nitrospiraceae bacterium]|nr:glycosyltransferase [Nitrospiraceae bacterium]
LTRKVIIESDRLVSVSAALKDTAGSIARPKKSIRVIYNGCDPDTFAGRPENRAYARRKLGIPETTSVLIFVGKISRDKGICELMESFRSVNRGNCGAHLLMVGSGPDVPVLQSMAASYGLLSNIHRTGDIPHGDIPDALNAADIFVLPSYHEGLPNAVLEAMACGLPVVATRAGGIPEAVEDGKSGILVPVGDHRQLANAIEYLLMNDSAAKRMGSRGRQIVETRFTWQVNSEKMSKLYREVMDEK